MRRLRPVATSQLSSLVISHEHTLGTYVLRFLPDQIDGKLILRRGIAS